tara:strand:- start:77 stop:1648 length:1572 start_codon:yes stop_codon:yes gene_type:complete
MSIQYTKEQIQGSIEGIQNEAEEFKETYFGDKEWHEGLGQKAWYPVKKLGDAQDFTNEQVNLRNVLRIGTNITDKIPGQWDERILDYSYKDLRDHTAGGFGNVVGALTGSERANDAAEILGQVLLPDAIDFVGGVGYADNLLKIPKALKKISAEDGARIVEEVFSLPRLKAVAGNVKESVYENARKIKDTVTAPVRTVQDLASGGMFGRGGPGTGITGGGNFDATKLAKVNKTRIKRFVEEFGGTDADVQRIMKEQILKDKNINQSRTWLNKYFNKLTEELGPGGLKKFAIRNVDGVPRLVEVATGQLRRAFEKDHMKAKDIFKKLAEASDDPELFAGANFHENLENVYTVFNRAKSNRPPIPDEISRAIGQSTSLREFVQRRLDDSFNEGMIQIPREFREAAKIRMLDAVQNTVPIKGKPKKLLNRIVEEEKALWKWLTPIMKAADTAPKGIQKQLDEFANSTNPVKDYENIKGLIEEMNLSPALVKRYKESAEKWLQMLQRSRRGGTPGGPDLSPGMFPDD